MAQTTEPYTGNGTRGSAGNALSFTFPYLKLTDVKVSLNGTTLATTKYTFPTATTLQFNTGSETTLQETSGAPKTGVSILIYRDTDVDSARHVFGQGSAIKSKDLNENKEQSLYFDQEVGDTTNPKNFVTSAQISDGTSLSAADKTKLDAIEANAKDDQTGAEIKTLYEAESNTNAFTDAEKTKLSTVEANAKDDQTATEIKSLYESNSDTNAFTDADHTKLDGIEANAINASNAAITNKLPLTGGLMTGDLILSSSVPKLRFVDTDGTASYRLINNSGAFKIQDTSDSNATRFSIFSTGNVNVDKNLTVNENLTVQGNIIVNGTSTTLNTATVNVDDKNFVLMSIDSPTDALAHNGGFTLRGDTDKTFQWKSGTDSWTSSEHIHLIDTKKLYLGDSRDLEIYHSGSHSYINDVGTGNLYIGGNNLYLTNTGNTEQYLSAVPNGAVELYYDNSKKFETTSNGILVYNSGLVFQTTASGTNTFGDIQIPNDTGKIKLGASQDLEIYHNGTNSHLRANNGALVLNADQLYIQSLTENYLSATANGAVELYYDNSKKFETRSGGATVSGTINATGGSFTGNLKFSNNVGTLFGASDELQVFHSSGTSYISHNGSGQLQLRAKASEHGIKIIPDGAVELYHNNLKKFETTSIGCKITDAGANTALQFINDNGGNGYVFANSTDEIGFKDNATHWLVRAIKDGAVELYYDNVKRLETTSTGVKVGTGGDTTSHIGNCNRLAILGDSTNRALLHIRGGSPGIFFDKSGTPEHAKIYQDFVDLSFYAGTPANFGTEALVIKSTSDIQIPNDNKKLEIGAGQDLVLRHNSVHSFVHTNTGNLSLSSDQKVQLSKADQDGSGNYEFMVQAIANGSVELYYDNSKKLETTSDGATITGVLKVGNNNSKFGQNFLRFEHNGAGYFDHNFTGQDLNFRTSISSSLDTTAFIIKSSGNVQIPADSKKLQLGASQDLALYHQHTTSSYGGMSVIESHTMPLSFKTNRNGNTEDGIVIYPNNRVELFYDNSKKLQTTSTGATVTTTSAANSIKNITTSTSGPSGGSDGDLWFTYVA